MNEQLLPRKQDRELLTALLGNVSRHVQEPYRDERHAKENHIFYAVCGGEIFHAQFLLALKEVVQLLDDAGVEYVLIKTEKRFPYDDSNIDIVCRTEEDFKKAGTLAERRGRKKTMSYHEPDKEMWRLSGADGKEQKPGWHLHRCVSWNGVPYLSNEGLFAGRQKITWEGATFWVPSLEYDLLIHAAHSIFENFQLTLGEFYDAHSRAKEQIDWHVMQQTAEKNGWPYALLLFLSALRNYAECVGEPLQIPETHLRWPTQITFPVRHPVTALLRVYRGRIGYHLRKKAYRNAFREGYAYPIFFLIEKIKHITGFQYP